MTPRRLTPEKLDSLPPDSAEAQHSRRDLWRLNALMRHRGDWLRWWRRTFPHGPPDRIAELGAGDGRLLSHALLAAFPNGGNGSRVTFVDLHPCLDPAVVPSLTDAGWTPEVIPADVFRWLADGPAQSAIVANLFLHHFDDAALCTLLQLAARKCRRFRALEPHRSRFGLLACRLLPLIGCHPVTLHDARVSVEAAFRSAELTTLWPAAGWRTFEAHLPPFGHVFEATATPPSLP